MPTFRAPRGTRDFLPAERAALRRLETIASDLARRYGYREIETPMFEQVAVFERGLGEATDAVEKELFRLAPRSDEGEAWALRPEPTAGIVRAYVQHGMQTLPQPVKVRLTGPMFRYDRPQAGRFRQFWQFDVEAIGDPGPAIDAELIELASRFYRDIGLGDVIVHVNSIGDGNCRPAYIEELTAYYRRHVGQLPPTERDRLEKNALRLLDSKDPAMAALNAARAADHGPAVRRLRGPLRRAPGPPRRARHRVPRGARPRPRPRLLHPDRVRVLAEGRRPAVGAGRRRAIRRPRRAAGRPAHARDRVRAGAGPGAARARRPGRGARPGTCRSRSSWARTRTATAERLRIATDLRGEGLAMRVDLVPRKLGRQLESAVKAGARFAVIVGDELADGNIVLRDLDAASQKPVALADLPALLRRKTGG